MSPAKPSTQEHPKDEGELLTEERERAYRERIAELKKMARRPPPEPKKENDA